MSNSQQNGRLAVYNLALLAGELILVGILGSQQWLYHELPFFAFIGLVYAHSLYIGALGSMGPWPWQIRLPVAGAAWFLTVLLDLMVCIGTMYNPPPWEVHLMLAASTVILVVALQLPIGPRFRRWRLRTDWESEPAGSTTFTLRHMFAWTTIVAVMLAVGRLIVAIIPQDSSRGGRNILYLAIIFFEFVVATLLIAWPLLWAVWSRSWGTKLVLSGVIAIVATLVQASVLEATTGRGEFLEAVGYLMLSNGTMFVVLLMHAAVVRWFGYRWA